MKLNNSEKRQILDLLKKEDIKTIEQFKILIQKELWIVLSERQAWYWFRKWKELKEEEINKEEKKLLKFLRKKWLNLKNLRELLEWKELKSWWSKKINLWDDKEIVIGIISDTHLGNKLCAIEELRRFYEIAENEWVKTILHWWDLTDWIDVYKWQVFELKEHSLEEQIEVIKKHYPKLKNWKTYYILWNHDESWLKKVGINIANLISNLRKDLEYLWFYNWRIILNWFIIDLQHWWWSQAYAKSYKLQKYLENYNKWDDPDIFILWHYHDSLYLMYRWIHSFLPGAFLRENLLAKRYKLWNTIWWWIVNLKKKWDKTEILTKFIAFD